jgi:hypothetical protein
LRFASRRLSRLLNSEGRRGFDLGGGNAGRDSGEQNGGGGGRAQFHNVHYASFGVSFGHCGVLNAAWCGRVKTQSPAGCAVFSAT